MLGAIIGDIAGSTYEFPIREHGNATSVFAPGSRFTDDTVLTVAVVDALINPDAKGDFPFREKLQEYTLRYPHAGFGSGYLAWAKSRSTEDNDSYGNGAAMRVSPIGHFFPDLEDVLRYAELSAMPSHSHPEALASVRAVAGSVFLARNGHPKTEILEFIRSTAGYDMDFSLDTLRPEYGFNSRSSSSVPVALQCFLDSADYADAIRLAISMGGDTDTEAAIAGSVAEAYYGHIPQEWKNAALSLLPDAFVRVIQRFGERQG